MMETPELLRLIFSPVRTEPSARTKAILDRASTEVEMVDGNKIVHYIWGNGEPRVLLVHGWCGNAGQVGPLADALVAAGFTVVAMDLPAHGDSEGEQASVVHFARVIEAADRRYGPFVAVAAHSLGAGATAIALSQGVVCEGLVLINPIVTYTTIWRLSEELFGASKEQIQAVARAAGDWLGIPLDETELATLAPGLSGRLLVIHDEQDRGTPVSESEALVAVWPGAELVKMQGLGHTRILSDEGTVRRTVAFVMAMDDARTP
jgi:pimeloyl-ACP methyl ester carboxylesterase